MKNGSIALLWKEQDAKKKKDINNPTINVPLKDSTNTESNPVRDAKRKSRSNDIYGGPFYACVERFFEFGMPQRRH